MKNSGVNTPAIVFITVFLFFGSATGQTRVMDADCTQDAACLAFKEQAAECSKRGDLVEALRLYKLAFEVRPDPRLFFNIARLLHKQGKTVQAVPYYQEFLDAPIQDEEQRQKARESLEQIQAAAAAPAQEQAKYPSSHATTSLAEVTRADAPLSARPVYKKWWFWTLVGGAAAAVVVGTAIGVSARQPDLSGVMQYRLMP